MRLADHEMGNLLGFSGNQATITSTAPFGAISKVNFKNPNRKHPFFSSQSGGSFLKVEKNGKKCKHAPMLRHRMVLALVTINIVIKCKALICLPVCNVSA